MPQIASKASPQPPASRAEEQGQRGTRSIGPGGRILETIKSTLGDQLVDEHAEAMLNDIDIDIASEDSNKEENNATNPYHPEVKHQLQTLEQPVPEDIKQPLDILPPAAAGIEDVKQAQAEDIKDSPTENELQKAEISSIEEKKEEDDEEIKKKYWVK